MTEFSNYQFYCLSYYKEKRNKMKDRFDKLGIKCNFYTGVKYSDNRIINKKCNNFKKKLLSIIYGHLEIINHFYHNSNTKYAIICEDDIIIHKDIKDLIRKVMIDFDILKLDILLLSYMIPYKITSSNIFCNFPLKKEMPYKSHYKYYDYPNYISGTQMYMITKSYAKYILDTYKLNGDVFFDYPFTVDKTLIHVGNKALLYPMLAIENDEQEDLYHQLCHKIHYDECFI